MRLGHDRHLTYCLNVHPGEAWADQERAVAEHAAAVKAALAPDRPFGLGLRISAQAAEELAIAPARVKAFKARLDDLGMYAFTVNAFPFGRFHGAPVKDEVYRPDWTQPPRRIYTDRVAAALAALLPEGVAGSISTCPLTFKGWPGWHARVPEALLGLGHAAAALARIETLTGKRIVLAMEPEPMCYPETTPELAEVMGRLRHEGARALARELHVAEDQARAWVTRHAGACFDTAHQAVEFEDPIDSLALLRKEGIEVAKAQLSAALEIEAADPAGVQALAGFQDTVYLHQAAWRGPEGVVKRWTDLPALLADAPGLGAGPVRVHYHVPLFWESAGPLRSTAPYVKSSLLPLLGATPHLEVETYTWAVWKSASGEAMPVDEGIARELRWVLDRLTV